MDLSAKQREKAEPASKEIKNDDSSKTDTGEHRRLFHNQKAEPTKGAAQDRKNSGRY